VLLRSRSPSEQLAAGGLLAERASLRLRVVSRAAVLGGRASRVIAATTVGSYPHPAPPAWRRLGSAAPDWRQANAERPPSPPAGWQCARPGTMT